MKKNISKFLVIFSLILFAVSLATAQTPPQPPHEVYGAVSYDEGGMASGVGTEVKISGNVIDSDSTDSNGGYALYVPPNHSGEDFTLYIKNNAEKTFTANSGFSDRYDTSVKKSSKKFSISLSDEDVDEGESADITPSVTKEGDSPEYSWTLIDDPTSEVSLDNDDEKTVSFNSPEEVDSDTEVLLEVEVTKGSDKSKTDTAVVTVNDNSLAEDQQQQETGQGSGSGGGSGLGTTDSNSSQYDTEKENTVENNSRRIEARSENNISTATVENVKAGQKVDINIPETVTKKGKSKKNSVESINFASSSDSDSVSVSVQDLGITKPGKVDEAGTDVYNYQEINVSGLTDQEITSANITFSVNKSFVDERNRTVEEVVMKRYSDGWQELSTQYRSETEDNYKFVANSNGFSYYAIALQENGTETEELNQETRQREESSDILKWILVILFIGAGATAVYFKDELTEYAVSHMPDELPERSSNTQKSEESRGPDLKVITDEESDSGAKEDED